MDDASNWYWIVAGRIYSSARNIYVDEDDLDYEAFVAAGKSPTPILNEAELWEVLATWAPGLLPPWLFDGATFVQPAPGEYTAAQLAAYAADKRWRKEVGGTVVAGIPVATDDRSKQMTIGARVAADADADWSTQWVGADGNVYPINATAIIAISDAVQAHVNACFATYATVKTAIAAGTITTTEDIDVAFA